MPEQRTPSIHITEQRLGDIVADLMAEGVIDIDVKENARTIAAHIAKTAARYALNNRSVSVTNDKLKRDTNKVTAAGRDATAKFVALVTLIRRRLRHRGMIAPKPGTPDWLNYKEVTKLASEFCNEFQLGWKEGYMKYIEIGMSKMANYSIFKFKTLHEAIYKEYEAEEKIRNDKYPEHTAKAHDYYIHLVRDRIGFCQGFEKNKEKYACFIDATKTAKEFGIDPRTYIKAQFAGFDWRSGIPDPLQLNGLKAIERLQNYAFENELKLGKENQKKEGINFKQIKKAGK